MNADAEREALERWMYHSGLTTPGQTRYWATRLLASDVWRTRRQGPITDSARDEGLRAWREHEWDPTPRLCACGEFFPALGRETNGHPEHRMRAALEAAREVS